VLEALVIPIPLIVSEALVPVAPCANSKLVPVDETEKLPALPEVLLVIASLDPDASVMMLAVTPRPALLIELSRSLSVLTPLPVVILEESPLLFVIVMLSDGRSVDALATAVEE
jgi:hypothetical protein